MPETAVFAPAVVDCLLYEACAELLARRAALTALVARVLDEQSVPQAAPFESHPSRQTIEGYLAEIRALLPAAHDRIALVYGGATKIKGYVFEAPKLPEIRGASALLDWVNDHGLRAVWREALGAELGEACIVYASGGGFLAFAPAELGEQLAAAAERCYTEHTLTANSVFVAGTFSLLELRYGRLALHGDTIPFWIDEFQKAWDEPASQRLLSQYYYSNDHSTPAERFYTRKTFGELATLLAAMASQRRDERASHGDTRSIPFYAQIPWAEKCDSSDLRPAVWSGRVAGEDRQLSEASARKRYVGQTVKKDISEATKWYRDTFPNWQIPGSLAASSWEQQWEQYLGAEGAYAHYADEMKRLELQPGDAEPPKDVGWIGQASSPRRYLSVIYADGNNVGRLIATLKTPHQYAAVSKSLSEVSKAAVFRALADCLEPTQVILTAEEKRIRQTNNDTCWVHPFEILTIGGDDLFIIVPGDRALDIAAAIGSYFEREITSRLREIPDLPLPKQALSVAHSTQRFDRSLTPHDLDYTPLVGLSAGVIVAQENAPIFFLRDLVEELLKSAKKLAKWHASKKAAKPGAEAKVPYYGGAVDFMVMKSITMVTDKIASFRRQALGDDGEDSARRLTARPYTWHELARLLESVREIKQARVPRSQLYRLRRALDSEPGSAITPSVMEYLYTRTRISPAYGDALLKHIERPWCWETTVPKRAAKLPPWMPLGKHGWETIWADLLEIYEMVPPKEQQ